MLLLGGCPNLLNSCGPRHMKLVGPAPTHLAARRVSPSTGGPTCLSTARYPTSAARRSQEPGATCQATDSSINSTAHTRHTAVDKITRSGSRSHHRKRPKQTNQPASELQSVPTGMGKPAVPGADALSQGQPITLSLPHNSQAQPQPQWQQGGPQDGRQQQPSPPQQPDAQHSPSTSGNKTRLQPVPRQGRQRQRQRQEQWEAEGQAEGQGEGPPVQGQQRPNQGPPQRERSRLWGQEAAATRASPTPGISPGSRQSPPTQAPTATRTPALGPPSTTLPPAHSPMPSAVRAAAVQRSPAAPGLNGAQPWGGQGSIGGGLGAGWTAGWASHWQREERKREGEDEGEGQGGSEGGARQGPGTRSHQSNWSRATAAQFRVHVMQPAQREWFSPRPLSTRRILEDIQERCQTEALDAKPLFMMARLARSPEDAGDLLQATLCIRAAAARHSRRLEAVGGEYYAAAFVRACIACDAPEVLAEGLRRANEAGLQLTYRAVHEGLVHWAAQLDLTKMGMILQAMHDSGLPPTTRTAYTAIRAAVNSARLDIAEMYASRFQAAGVRLNDATQQFLALARQRHRDREAAMNGSM